MRSINKHFKKCSCWQNFAKARFSFFLPTRKSHQGKDRGLSKAKGRTECPAGKRKGGEENLSLGEVWPSRRPSEARLVFALALPASPGAPAAAFGCCRDQTCGEIDTTSYRRNANIKLLFKASKNQKGRREDRKAGIYKLFGKERFIDTVERAVMQNSFRKIVSAAFLSVYLFITR